MNLGKNKIIIIGIQAALLAVLIFRSDFIFAQTNKTIDFSAYLVNTDNTEMGEATVSTAVPVDTLDVVPLRMNES